MADPPGRPAAALMYCTCRVDDLYLGIDVAVVQEVLREQPVTPVPLAPPEVRGLVNLRGRIVPAVDLGRRLGRPAAVRRTTVVVRIGSEVVCLLVDVIEDVVTLAAGDHRPVPATVDPSIAAHLGATGLLDSELLLVLDPVAACVGAARA